MATILRSRVAWTKPRDPTETRRSTDLTPKEADHARAALRFLRVRLGGGPKLATLLRVNEPVLRLACSSRQPSAAMAIRAARIAGVPVENVLSGAWPPAGACPHCGRY